MILRSRWGPGVGQQGPAVGTNNSISCNKTQVKTSIYSVMVFHNASKTSETGEAKKSRGKSNHKGDHIYGVLENNCMYFTLARYKGKVMVKM